MRLTNLLLVMLIAILLFDVYDTLQPLGISTKTIAYEDLNTDTQKQIACLTDNIYYEARGEPKEGKQAVAYTTLNRLEDGQWSNSICGVVKQKIGNTCQFSWICDRNISKHRIDEKLYNECKRIAIEVYLNYVPGKDDLTGGSTFYHATYVSPKWKHVEKTVQIGNHIFYKLVDNSNRI